MLPKQVQFFAAVLQSNHTRAVQVLSPTELLEKTNYGSPLVFCVWAAHQTNPEKVIRRMREFSLIDPHVANSATVLKSFKDMLPFMWDILQKHYPEFLRSIISHAPQADIEKNGLDLKQCFAITCCFEVLSIVKNSLFLDGMEEHRKATTEKVFAKFVTFCADLGPMNHIAHKKNRLASQSDTPASVKLLLNQMLDSTTAAFASMNLYQLPEHSFLQDQTCYLPLSSTVRAQATSFASSKRKVLPTLTPKYTPAGRIH